jgi:YcfA-like protein.
MHNCSTKSGFLCHPSTWQPHSVKKTDPFTQLVVPDHKKLDTGTLRSIIRQSGLSVDEFLKLI